jgi:hypothetical protein
LRVFNSRAERRKLLNVSQLSPWNPPPSSCIVDANNTPPSTDFDRRSEKCGTG